MSTMYVFDESGLNALINHIKTTRTMADSNESAIGGLGEDLVGLTEAVQSELAGKQNTLTFDTTPTEGSSNPVTSDGVYKAMEENGGADVYTATIGTTWTENEDTGVKSQTVSIPGITADNTAKVDHSSASIDGTSEGYETFVEEENQYLTCITNGYAETVEGGITFHIFGDAPTVSIPIIVEVV